jgi:predicted amidophosphoribosyltransferase
MASPDLAALAWEFFGCFGERVLPGGCRLCEQLLTDARRLPLCEDCLRSFQEIPAVYCDLCALPGTIDPEFPRETSFCADCQRRRFAFEFARNFDFYEGALARAILLLKVERAATEIGLPDAWPN